MSKIKKIIREFITERQYNQLLGENGLIITRDPNVVVNSLNKWYNKGVSGKHFRSGGSFGIIEVTFKDKSKENVESINKLMNNYGYFPSTWFTEPNSGNFRDINNIDHDSLEIIRYEPKFDIIYTPENRYLYHVTDKKHVNKILKNGLTPKTKSKVTDHPDRIYFSTDIGYMSEIMDIFVYDNHINYHDIVKLKVDIHNLHIPFMVDGQFPGGVYTTHNIPPNRVEIIN